MSPPPTKSAARTTVRIAQLKAHLSACLREVGRGQILTVLDRDRPIARVVPIDEPGSALAVRRAKGRVGDVPLPRATSRKRKANTLALLLEDRRGGR